MINFQETIQPSAVFTASPPLSTPKTVLSVITIPWNP